MTSAVQKPGLPGWLKIVLIVTAVIVVLTIGLIGGCAMFFGNMMKEVQDPNHIRQVAASFMRIGEPLPAGFQYKLGINLLGNRIVGFKNESKDLFIVIGDFADKSIDLSDPETAINKVTATSGLAGHHGQQARGSNIRFETKKKGSEIVGGRQMNYVIGPATNTSTGRTSQTFIGTFSPPTSGTVCIFGSTDKDTYDLQATEELLKDIQSI